MCVIKRRWSSVAESTFGLACRAKGNFVVVEGGPASHTRTQAHEGQYFAGKGYAQAETLDHVTPLLLHPRLP